MTPDSRLYTDDCQMHTDIPDLPLELKTHDDQPVWSLLLNVLKAFNLLTSSQVFSNVLNLTLSVNDTSFDPLMKSRNLWITLAALCFLPPTSSLYIAP